MHSKLVAFINREFPEVCNLDLQEEFNLCKWSCNSNPGPKQKQTTLSYHKCRILDTCYAAISAQSFETEGYGKFRTFLQRASPHGVIIEQTPEKCWTIKSSHHPSYGCHLSNPTLSKIVSIKIQKYSTNTRGRAVGDYCVILKSDCGQIQMQWQGLHQ